MAPPPAPTPAAPASTTEGERQKRPRKEKSHGGSSKRLKRAARRSHRTPSPGQTIEEAVDVEEQDGEPASTQVPEGEAAQGAPSLFTSANRRKLALAKYESSVFAEDRKRVENPSLKSIYEALVSAGQVSFHISYFS